MVSVLRSHGAGPIPVAIERCEGILVEALQVNGYPLFPVSPRVSARARERYQGGGAQRRPL